MFGSYIPRTENRKTHKHIAIKLLFCLNHKKTDYEIDWKHITKVGVCRVQIVFAINIIDELDQPLFFVM